MSANRYGVLISCWCANVAARAGVIDAEPGVTKPKRSRGVHPIAYHNNAGGVEINHNMLVFPMPNRSAARQTVTRALRAFDATKPNLATMAHRDAYVVTLGEHAWDVRGVLP